MKLSLIFLSMIGATLAQEEMLVSNGPSSSPICGASASDMDQIHCSHPVIMSMDPSRQLVACANSCFDFYNILDNPPWVSNTQEQISCSNIWADVANNITEDRQVSALERKAYNLMNCTTEPGCCNNMGNWYEYTFDECGENNGDNSTCADCAGTPNGNAVLDACDVCNGDNSTCADCAGTPNGDAVLDACDVCNGDGSSCADCAGTPNGDAVLDACDVCNGDGSSCTDCEGTPNGDAVLDACDVCNGDGSSCADCEGTPNGDAILDACDVCNGDGSSCADCEGTPNGDAILDACDVCNGDGSSCADCEGTPNGNATLDKCNVCNGDGSSCSSSISQWSTLELILFILIGTLLAILLLIFCMPVPKNVVKNMYDAQEELLKRGSSQLESSQLEQGIKLKF